MRNKEQMIWMGALGMILAVTFFMGFLYQDKVNNLEQKKTSLSNDNAKLQQQNGNYATQVAGLKSEIEMRDRIIKTQNSFDEAPKSALPIKVNPFVESIISYEYVNEVRCTKKDIDLILNTANLYGIKNPYIPVKGIATEYVMEVRKEQDAFEIAYPHFSITESTRDLIPSQYQEKKEVKLNIGNAIWVTIQGQESLFLKLNNVYISISSAKPFTEMDFEKVAESIVRIISGADV